MASATSVYCLEELYSYLKNDEGFDILTQTLTEWEYDLDLLKDDIINEEDVELQEIIPQSLYAKIKSLIEGDYTENNNNESKIEEKHTAYDAQLVKLKTLIFQMSDADAAQQIIDKIAEDEFGYDDIRDDIEDRDDSGIYSHLKENHALNLDTIFNTFSDMVQNLNNYNVSDAINITADGPESDIKIPYQHQKHIYTDSDEEEQYDEHQMDDKELIYYNISVNDEKEQEMNVKDLNISGEWNIVLKAMKNHTRFERNIYEQGINYYKSQAYTIEAYIDTEANSYEESDIQNAYPNLPDTVKKDLWQDLTKCVRFSRYRKHALSANIIPSIPPKPKPKTNRCIHVDEDAKSISIACNTNVFVDDEKSDEYQRVDKILSNIEKLHISTDKPPDLKQRSIAFRRLCSIFGMNATLLMVDLKIAIACIAFDHSTYGNMLLHLNEVERDRVKNEYYDFIRSHFGAKTYDRKQFNLYVQGLNISQATRLLGYGRLSQIIVGIRNPENKADVSESDEDDADDGYMDEISIKGSDEERLNWYSLEAQQYMYAFIVATTKHLLKDYYDLNCGVVLDLKVPSIEHCKPAMNMNVRINFRKRMDSLTGRFTPVFEHKLLRPTFRRQIEEGYKIPIWCIDVNKTENERFDNQQQPKYIGISKKEIDVDISDKEYVKDYDKNHWFHIMRVKRYFSQKAISDKNSGDHKRIGIAVHKFQQTIKLYLHFAGGVIRITPKDIVKWIPYLFMYREDELKWNDIKPYLQGVLKDNKALSRRVWDPQINYIDDSDNINIWTQIKNWHQLDSEYIEKRNLFFEKVKKIPTMCAFAAVFDADNI